MDIVQHRLVLPDREIVLLACEHVRPESVAQLCAILAEERPEAVCIELDAQRLSWLENRAEWEAIDLVEVMRRKQMPLLSSHLALRIFQKRLARFTDLDVGDEMWAAVQAAREVGAEVVLADREMLTTGVRAWRNTSSWSRPKIALALTFGTLQKTRKDKKGSRRNENVAERVIDRLNRQLPTVKKILVDERDFYMAQRIRQVAARRIVVVVGPAHVDGLLEQLQTTIDVEEVEKKMLEVCYVPTQSRFARALPWLASVLVVVLFVAGFLFGDTQKILDAAVLWIVLHTVLAGVATVLAFGHFWTVLAVAVVAPFVSLNPFLAAGLVGAAVQLFAVPPSIREIERVGDDITRWSGWWHNRLARTVLVLVFANIGNSIATLISAWMIIG